MNKILTPLPAHEIKQGAVDWSKINNQIIEIIYDGKILKVFIESYNRETQNLKISKYKEDGRYSEYDWFNIKAYHFKNLHLNKFVVPKLYEWFESSDNSQYEIDYNENKELLGYNEKYIKSLTFGNKTRLYIKCNKCNSSILRVAYNIIIGQANCGVCANKVIIKGINDVATTHPNIVNFLVDKEVANKLSYGNHKKVKVKCPLCGMKQKNLYPLSVVVENFSCEFCSDKRPYPERILSTILQSSKLEYEYQKRFKWSLNFLSDNNKLSGDKVYDFYIPSLNIIIETHGGQHYKKSGFSSYGGRSLEEEIENDEIKKNLALKNNISNYIVIDCRKSTINWIKRSIINSNLKKYIDFQQVDWKICEKVARQGMVYKVCQLWSQGISIKQLSKEYSLTTSTITSYLNIGKKIGLCNYNGERSKASLIGKQIINVDTKEEYLTVNEAARAIGVHSNALHCCINNPNKSCKKNKWMYLEDYNNNNQLKKLMQESSKYHNSKEVYCITTNTKFASISEAKRITGSSHISECCKGIANYSGNDERSGEKFMWIYMEDYLYLINNYGELLDREFIKSYLKHKYKT